MHLDLCARAMPTGGLERSHILQDRPIIENRYRRRVQEQFHWIDERQAGNDKCLLKKPNRLSFHSLLGPLSVLLPFPKRARCCVDAALASLLGYQVPNPPRTFGSLSDDSACTSYIKQRPGFHDVIVRLCVLLRIDVYKPPTMRPRPRHGCTA